MEFIREGRKSVAKTLEDHFINVANWNPAFNIYDSEDMKSGKSDLTRPFIFIIDSFIMFEMKHLPVIVIECDAEVSSIGLSEKAAYFDLNLHIFGQSRGERDDLAGDIMKNITAISIYNFDPTVPVLVETQNLIARSGTEIWKLDNPDITTEVAIEETLGNWTVISSRFMMNI